jgi:hypothetical protein
MTEFVWRRQNRVVATLLILLGCSACGDPSGKQSSDESHVPLATSSDHLTEATESKNRSESCRSAKQDIAASDQTLEKAFNELRSQRNAFYDARKSAYLSTTNEKDPPASASASDSFTGAGASQKDEYVDTSSLDDKQKTFYAAYRKADETLSSYDKIGCLEAEEYVKKHTEYNGLLGRN